MNNKLLSIALTISALGFVLFLVLSVIDDKIYLLNSKIKIMEIEQANQRKNIDDIKRWSTTNEK